ncbi:MAG: tetratricopeptide repeat protein [Deltaproteobacteria bacterium]|nr:tetratricopeptide repeat protein [Deltaproteobacteria bacterium]
MQTIMTKTTERKKTGLPAILLLGAVILAFMTSCATMEHRKEDAQRRTAMGIAYMKSGEYTDALKEFIEADRMYQSDPTVYYYMGACYYAKGMTDRAADELLRAIALDPDYAEAHNYLGMIYLERGDADGAISEFEKALSNVLYRTPALALNNIGIAYYNKKDYKNALDHYFRALDREPNTIILPLIYNNIGRAFMDDGNIDSALVYFSKASEIAPTLAEPHYLQGLCHLKKGDFKAALQALRKAAGTQQGTEYSTKASECLKTLTGSP